jgi:hypothetical protein
LKPKIVATAVHKGQAAKVSFRGNAPELIALLCCAIENLAGIIGVPNADLAQCIADLIREHEEEDGKCARI